MRIWHVGSTRTPHAVNGVNSMVWTLAGAQAAAGHDVLILVGDRPDIESAATARRMKVTLLHLPCTQFQFDPDRLADRLRLEKPDVVHLHSVFVPWQASLARTLIKHKIPYVITPHGGLLPQILARRKALKSIYSTFLERPRFRASSAITLVSPAEEKYVRDFVGDYKNPMPWIPNPVNTTTLDGHEWDPAPGKKRLVFLGRFDIQHKGIDLLLEIARHLPNVEMHLYGENDERCENQLNDLKRMMSPNVFFHDPVYDHEKSAVLQEATMYVQMSRWEGFPVSVSEAMYLGVPCALNEDLEISSLFRENDLGLLLPSDPKAAATKIAWALEHAERMKEWSKNARAYAQAKLLPAKVAEEYTRLYQRAIPMTRQSWWSSFFLRAASLAGVAAMLADSLQKQS